MTVLGTGRAILVTSRILVTILVTVDFFVAILVTSRSQHTIAGTLRRNLTVKLIGLSIQATSALVNGRFGKRLGTSRQVD